MDLEQSWRISLAKHVSSSYSESGKVAAVLIGGSVALGIDDKFSDIDLFVFWDRPPSEVDRERAVIRSGGKADIFWANPPTDEMLREKLFENSGRIGQIWPYESDEWSEHYFIGNVNIGISGFLISTVTRYLKEITQTNGLSDDIQILLAAIVEGIPIAGGEIIQRWKQSAAAFPESLARILVSQAMTYDESWRACEMVVARNNRLYFQELVGRMVDKILRALLALNRIYLPDPRHKWLDIYAQRMAWKPDDLIDRLKTLATADPSVALAEIESLFLETLDLVDRELPGVDTVFPREWIRYRRPIIEQYPIDWLSG